ncbi:MAG: hypothetical protein ACK5K7_05050 [Bacilli bacterium]
MFIYDKLELATEVKKCYEHNGKIYAILNNTVFYPESGGQNSDVGTIGTANVLSVFKYEEDILHEIDGVVSGDVYCKVNETVRYNNSLLHTAQHLFSAIFEMSGYDTTSFSMKGNYFTIDIVEKLNRLELDKFENKINDCIRKGNRVEGRYYNHEIDTDINISNTLYEVDKIRLVIIENIEKNICGGTHVENISEIKYLKIIKFKYSGNKTRVDVMIGSDAINYINNSYNIYYDIVKLINQNDVDTYSYIESKLKENKKIGKKLQKLEKSLLNDKK